MKIASSDITLSSSHAATSTLETQDKLRAWIGNQRPDFEGRNAYLSGNRRTGSSTVQISDAARAAQAAPNIPSTSNTATDAVEQAADASDNDPRVRLIKYIVELLTGKKINTLSSADLQQDAAATPSVQSAAGSAPAPAAPAPVPQSRMGCGSRYP